MARSMTTFCDRCGAQVEDHPKGARQRITRFDSDYHGTQVDLCTACFEQFKVWLERGNGGAPPGYEFKPRPCPHQVPCADPQGCAGVELIPLLGGDVVEVNNQ
jgi:hypothetical protein